MMSEAFNVPLGGRYRRRLRLTAVGAGLLLVICLLIIQRLPAAERLSAPDNKLSATGSQAIALYDLRAAPVMQYDGAAGAGLRVGVSTARLSPATRQRLVALGVQLPNVRGAAFTWQGRPGPNGRISVRIGNQRQAPDAGLMIEAGSGGTAELNIRAVQTGLTAQIDIASQGGAQGPGAELKFGDSAFSDPNLNAAPVQIEIPPGETMTLTFDSEDVLADSNFGLGERLGNGGRATVLALGRAEAGPPSANGPYPQLASVGAGMCAAPAGRLLFMHSYPTDNECSLGSDETRDHLFATGASIGPNTVALTLRGSGFVLRDGTVRRPGLGSTLVANPLVAALVAVLVAAIAWPLWQLRIGRGM